MFASILDRFRLRFWSFLGAPMDPQVRRRIVLIDPWGGPRTVLGTFVGGPGPSWAEKCEEHSYLENVLISRTGARSAALGSVLSCSWSLCWWSWAAHSTYVGGLGLVLGPKLTVLGRLGADEVGLGP